MRVFLIIAIFLAFVALMYRRKINTLVGLPAAALLIGLAAGIPFQGLLNDVISEGAMRLHNPMIVIIFGATLAELVKRSGIVEVLIKNTAEFLGDRLIAISIFLMLIISLLFTVLSGLGAIVMVGSIVFPIMISLGISKLLSGCIFLVGLSLGGMLNLFNWSLYTGVLGLEQSEVMHFVMRFFPAALLVSIAFIVIELRRETGSSFRLQVRPRERTATIHPLAFLTPIIPVVIMFGAAIASFNFPIVAAMLIGIVYGVATAPSSAGPRIRLLTRSMFDGIANVGPAIALMIGIGMLLKSVAHPSVRDLLAPLLQSTLPTTAWGYVGFFTLCAPLALYRGPLNIWGMGSGLVVLMKDTGYLPAAAIMAALMAVGQIQGVSDPTNTQNVWVANYLGTDVIKMMKKTLLYMWVLAMTGLLIAAATYY